MNKTPIRVAITGAAGQIGYSLLFRIASGAAFGPDQPVILHLIEVPDEKAMAALGGVCMELDDCAFPLLKGLVPTSNLDENRAKSQLAKKASVDITAVTNLAIWGNHSATMFPDYFNTKINGRLVPEVISHREWLEKDFIT